MSDAFSEEEAQRSQGIYRFLLQMRLFLSKDLRTYDFVLLFQFENAKTGNINNTSLWCRISSASADFCCAAKALSHSIYGVGPCVPALSLLGKKRRLSWPYP